MGYSPQGAHRIFVNLTLALFSLSVSFQWAVLSALLLPADVLRFIPASEKNFTLSWITGLGALIAMISQPYAGAWSDRWSGRWGRRRPLILLGTALNGLGLAGMTGSTNLTEYVAAFLVMDVGSNLAIGAYHGLWRDRAPAHQKRCDLGLGWVSYPSGVCDRFVVRGYVSCRVRSTSLPGIDDYFPAGALLTEYSVLFLVAAAFFWIGSGLVLRIGSVR